MPKSNNAKPFRYRTHAYLDHKEERRERKWGSERPARRSDSASSSSSDDDNDPKKFLDDDCFWDEQELIKMQMDEVHAAQEYYKVTITRSTDKQDQDYFRIECDVAKWPHPEVEYQYLMENLVLKQMRNPSNGETIIKICGLKIRNKE